jgi:hypothetical protein
VSTDIPLVWFIAMGVGFGLLLGYAIGMALGITTGRQQLIKRVKHLVAREHLDFDIEGLLRSDRHKPVSGFGV